MTVIAARPTIYKGARFRSRLEARWAVFFDLLEWEWKYEPIDFVDWVPDFSVKFSCNHSECVGSHNLYAEVKPYHSLGEFEKHPVMKNGYGLHYGLHGGLALGIDPSIASMEIAHGAGGGIWLDYDIFCGWSELDKDGVDFLWNAAGKEVQWLKDG